MAEGGKRLALVLEKLLRMVRPGVTAQEIENRANELISQAGGSPSFKKVSGYHWATCINFNQGVVHGIPTGRKILPGDLVSIDVGLFYKGFHSDAAWTVMAGSSFVKNQEEIKLKRRFLSAGEGALKKVLDSVEPDLEIKDILRTVYEHLSLRIAEVLSGFHEKDVLISGGGAHNTFLLELLQKEITGKLVLPDTVLIDFKEAIIFGFLGYLRYNKINNILKSVTGAERDCCGGLLVDPIS